MTRAFVAVALPDPVLEAVASVTDATRLDGVRRTTPDQWHVTLQFLGTVDLDAVTAALDRFRVRPAPVRLGGGGAFPDARRARVLWLGVREGAEFFASAASEVARRLAPVGFRSEDRPYHPHVTLARTGVPADLRDVVQIIDAAPDGPSWLVSEIVVFESRTDPAGARYVPRARVSLER